jgi:hypothetical protein
MKNLSFTDSPPHSARALTRACRPLPASGGRLRNCGVSVLAILSPLAGRGRIALAIRVRGSFRKRRRNDFENTLDIVQDIMVPESEHPVMMLDQPLVTGNIAHIVSVLPTIHLNDQAPLPADQIDDVVADRLLSHKLVSVQGTCAKAIPKRILGIGRISPQPSGTCGSDRIGLAHVEAPPHPALRADLSPQAGRG